MTKIADIVKAQASETVRKLNPEVFKTTIHIPESEDAEPGSPLVPVEVTIKKPHPVIGKFISIWALLDGPEWVKEYRFHKTRRWRFDFAIPEQKIAIEINGGIWNYGRHNRASGYIKDLEKMNEAQLLGWRVFQLHNATITAPNLKRIIEATRVNR